MKKIILCAIITCCVISVKAQTKAEKEVIKAVENMRLALISGERSALENLAAADLSYGHSGGKIQDKTAFVEAFVNGSSDFVSIEYKNQTIKVTDKTAIVRHQLHAVTNDSGKPGEAHIGVMLVFQKQGKSWKLLGRQAFKLPV